MNADQSAIAFMAANDVENECEDQVEMDLQENNEAVTSPHGLKASNDGVSEITVRYSSDQLPL